MNSSTDRPHGRRIGARFTFWCFRNRHHSGPCMFFQQVPMGLNAHFDPEAPPPTSEEIAEAMGDIRAALR